MTDNNLTLLCLVDGVPASRMFEIEVSKTQHTRTAAHLKHLIKAKQALSFDDITADQLTLWHVSIPVVVPASSSNPIRLSEIPVKTELKLTDDISDVLKETPPSPKKKINIIIQRPTPATPVIKRNVPDARVGSELAFILQAASRQHFWHAVDESDVTTAQKEKLGPFYKKTLPYGATPSSINLPMLGMMLNKEPRTRHYTMLRTIVERDIGKTRHFQRVAMVGPSGCGKTAALMDLAKRHFIVYFVCCDPRSMSSSGDFKDPNFIKLAQDVEQMYRELPTPDSSYESQKNNSDLSELVANRVELEFLARMLLLQLLFNGNAQLTPEGFFREQTHGGVTTIEKLVKKLRMYDTETISLMCSEVQNKIAGDIAKRGLGLVIALDDAQVASECILPGKFISTGVLFGINKRIFDDKYEIREIYGRGVLSPLSAALSHRRATLVMLGTLQSLLREDSPYGTIAKDTGFRTILQFPSFDDQNVEDVLSELVDISGCAIPDIKRLNLTGRPRFSVSVVRELFKLDNDPCSKQTKLDKAVDSAINQEKEALCSNVRDLLDNDTTGEIAHLLGRMVLAYKLQGGNVWFSGCSQADFINKALCSVHIVAYDTWLMDEPLVVEVVEEELVRSNVDPEFSEHLHQLNGIIEKLGVKPSPKGDALEPLVRQSLRRFNNCYLADLPFLKNIELPTWCHGLKLQIDDINTASGFGYGSDDTMADLQFLVDRPSNTVLVQQSGESWDSAWFFSDTHYAGALAIKCLSDEEMSEYGYEKYETCTDIRCSFLPPDWAEKNPSMEKIRDNFVASCEVNEIKGVIRIHIVFPGVKHMYEKPVTHVKRDASTGIEDVMVYIEMSNMDEFFYEGIGEDSGDILNLKRVIRYVLSR
ncbi:hypothetical protein BG004_001975 [Podila humilis]|nr:hypothetical protein BG004_001975 [Podila humilis]